MRANTMIRPETREAVKFLDALVKIDSDAMQALIETRVGCNEMLASHPTVQVNHDHESGRFTVGLLGVLNGWFGAYDGGPRKGWGAVGAVFDDGKLTGFVFLENE